MDALKTITQRIEDGFVMNEQGRWLYMAEQRIYERRVIEQIVNGNVLFDGKWVAIGEARRLAQRSKAAAQRKPAQPTPPPAPVTPLKPPQPHTETTAFEAMGDMMETICMDMSAIMPPAPAANDSETDDGPTPAHVDSVLISGLSTSTAADQSRYAMAYIDELNLSRKRGGLFGKLAKLSIALAAIAAAVLVIMQLGLR